MSEAQAQPRPLEELMLLLEPRSIRLAQANQGLSPQAPALWFVALEQGECYSHAIGSSLAGAIEAGLEKGFGARTSNGAIAPGSGSAEDYGL